jgi:electron transport complex protein RnfG
MMKLIKNPIFSVGFMLALFAIVATSMVTLTETNTREKIRDNERQTLLSAINALIDTDSYNNEILSDTLTLAATPQLGTKEASVVYRARTNNQPVAVVLSSIAPNGYNGEIKLLLGIKYDGELAGVRVISHKETPGLGDKIDEKKSDWILKFEGLSLTNPTESKWKVTKDGGEFDQFTGATITPRAIVEAVKKALVYFQQHRDQLFEVNAHE